MLICDVYKGKEYLEKYLAELQNYENELFDTIEDFIAKDNHPIDIILFRGKTISYEELAEIFLILCIKKQKLAECNRILIKVQAWHWNDIKATIPVLCEIMEKLGIPHEKAIVE